MDLAVASYGSDSLNVLIANPRTTNFQSELDLTTRAGAREAMLKIDEQIVRVGKELGQIGATQSRIGTAMNSLVIRQENYTMAASQIREVDVAEEAALLVRSQILQQMGAAVLPQSNQSPALSLKLLNPG